MTAPGITTESIPPIFAAGSHYPVDQLGLVGPWDKTEQSVLPGSDKKKYETNPSGPVGTDASFRQIQPVAEGPVGQYITHSQWAQMEFFPHVIQINRWMKAQWASITHETRWVQTCDPDQPSGIVGPVDPRNMFSQCIPDQPVAVGPVGQLFTTGPVGPCGIVANHELHDPIADSPMGLTETPDPVDEMERPIQIDFMKIVQTDGAASLVDTPPSSDSAVHSWGEQWENMSISTADTETEQNGKPRICSPTGRCVSDTREPPNTEDGESDELSASGIQNCNNDAQHNEYMDLISDHEPTSAEVSWEDDGFRCHFGNRGPSGSSDKVRNTN